MKKSKEVISKAVIELKKWPLILKNPLRFIDNEPTEKVNIIQLMYLILWWMVLNFEKFFVKGGYIRIFSLLSSIIGMTIYLKVITWIGGGKKKVIPLINLSIYINFIYVLLNAVYAWDKLLIVFFVVCHVYAYILHYKGLTQWLGCSHQKLRIVLIIEGGIIVIGFVNQLMIYAGLYMAYSSKILYYPYIS